MKKLLIIVSTLLTIALALYFTNAFDNSDSFIKHEIDSFKAQINPKADNPDIAAFQNYLQTVDPVAERVPVERLYRVHKAIDRAQYQTKGTDSAWEQIPTAMGGRTRTLVWDPNDPDTSKVWAGSVSGGLWYNNNIHSDTSSWQPAGDFWPSLSVSSIAFDPNDPQIIYVGTGEAETAVITYRESGGRGTGIMKSTDGGETWSLLQNTDDFYYVTDIVIREEGNESVIYAGVTSGVYMGDEHQSTPSNGLYRSNSDGQYWTQVLPTTEMGTVPPVADIEVTAGGRIFVGTMNNVDGDKGSEIFYSDFGTVGTWTRYTDMADLIVQQPEYNLTGRVKLAASPSDSSVIYAAFSVGTLDNLLQGFPTWEGRYILRSDDAGETWTEVNIPTPGGNQWAYLSWHALVLRVDPNNPDRIWAGGLDLHRSDDGGQTWEKYSDWVGMYYGGGPEYAHADQHAIAYKPGSSSVAVFGTDGGVFYSNNADGNTTFADYNKGFNTLQFYTGKISPFQGNNAALGGLQDNGSLLFNGAPLSPDVMVSGGDGGYCYFDPLNEGAYISTVYENTFSTYLNESDGAYINNYTSGTFTSPFAVNWEDQVIYANAVSFTGNYNDQLLIVEDFYSYSYNGTFAAAGTGSDVPFSYLALSPFTNDFDRLWAGTADGKLFQIDAAGTTLSSTDISGANFPEGFISSIQYVGSEDTLMVTFSNYGVSSVWLTTDGGEQWVDCEGNLPDIPVRYALFHPENSRQVILATETGLWQTTDIFSSPVEWQLIEAFPHVRTDMIDVRAADNQILAATHGRGMFVNNWEKAEYIGMTAGLQENLKLHPNPVRTNQSVTIKPDQAGPYRLLVTSTTGKVLDQREGSIQPGKLIAFTPQQSGVYIVMLWIGNKKHTTTLVVQ